MRIKRLKPYIKLIILKLYYYLPEFANLVFTIRLYWVLNISVKLHQYFSLSTVNFIY